MDLGDVLAFNNIEMLRESPTHAERALAIAMGLEAFGLASRLADALTEGSRRVSEATWIMGEAAKIRCVQGSLDLGETDKMLRSAWEQLSGDERPRLCLGYAETAFRLWERGRYAAFGLGSNAPRGVVDRWPGDPLGTAAWGLRLVTMHLDALEGHAKEFALDYVYRTVSRLDLPATELTGAIAEVESEPRSNGYRRLAIIGFALYLRAVRNLPVSGQSDLTAHSEWRAKYHKQLVEGVAMLAEARDTAPRDSDVNYFWRTADAFLSLEIS